MKQEFTIFKKGMTEVPVIICSMNGFSANGKPFNKSEKMGFYKSLGYTVTEL